MMNLDINFILDLINKEKFDDAKNYIEKTKNSVQLEIIFNLEGLIELRRNNIEKSILFFKNSINKNPKYLSAYTNLISAYEKIGDFLNAEKYLKDAIDINSNLDSLYNYLGLILFKQDKYLESIDAYQRSIEIKNNFKALFNLGNVYDKIKDYKKAIDCYQRALLIDKNLPNVRFNLAESLKNINDIKGALTNYELSLGEKLTWLRKEKIEAKILECFLILNKKKDYVNSINNLSKESTTNRRIAATANFIDNQFNLKGSYPFCPNPFDFIYLSSLEKYFTNYDNFIADILEEVLNLSFSWEPLGKTTRKGLGTKGNLSKKNLFQLKILEKYILEEVKEYYNLNKGSENTFITNWPDKFTITSWSNRLQKQGYNITHIHPSGWVSGVFYLQIPKGIKKDEAGIEFSLHGDDYYIRNKNTIPIKRFQPMKGDIIFFPSSLFHRTIPFTSDQERICIAFDLCKG